MIRPSPPPRGEPPGRVVVAMSGGVDSSVAAALLRADGYDVVGVTLRLRDCAEARGSRSCCGVDGLVRARQVAAGLAIRHYELDCVREFEELVLRPAWDDYARGRTPSPCLLCNERVKLGLLLDWAADVGASHVATGHYARIGYDERGAPRLFRGADHAKDQSYFLAGLDARRLGSVLFPLGTRTKREVRALAASLRLPTAGTPESQNACLVADGLSFAETLRRRFGAVARPGPLVDDEGRVLAEHPGIHHFTVGQRRGIPLRSPRRTWVLAVVHETSTVVVTHEAGRLSSRGFVASGLAGPALEPSGTGALTCTVQVRSRHPAVGGLVQGFGAGRARVTLAAPVRAIAPGQAAVFFEGDRILGRGWIDAAG